MTRSTDRPDHLLLGVAALVVLLEAAALVALAVVEAVTVSSGRLAVGLTTTAFFLIYGIGLALGAVALARARSWARAPLVLTQLIQLGLAWSFAGPGTYWVAILLGASGALVLVILVLPSTTRALYGERRAPDTGRETDSRPR